MNGDARPDKLTELLRDALQNLLIALAMGWDLEAAILEGTAALKAALPAEETADA